MFKRIISLVIVVNFILSSVIPNTVYAQALALPAPGTMVGTSEAFTPVILKGLQVKPENPMLFDFIVDTGDTGLQAGKDDAAIREESQKLVKYFMASLTLQEKDQWVNLSPYEKDRMMPSELEKTGLGRDMLAEDYILKQVTASLIHPDQELGKQFWAKVYAQAAEKFGSTEIPVDTFNKVWVVADKADVYVHDNTAFVVGSHLKVMLESDYLAQSRHSEAQRAEESPVQTGSKQNNAGGPSLPSGAQDDGSFSSSQDLAKQVVREIILPALETEVNTGKNFANLRQIFHSMILATWYKQNLKEALLNQVYADKAKTNGVERNAAELDPQTIFTKYVEAYKKGVFNFIKEDTTATGETLPRKYFSGGMTGLAKANIVPASDPEVSAFNPDHAMRISVQMTKPDEAMKVTSFVIGNKYLAAQVYGLWKTTDNRHRRIWAHFDPNPDQKTPHVIALLLEGPVDSGNYFAGLYHPGLPKAVIEQTTYPDLTTKELGFLQRAQQLIYLGRDRQAAQRIISKAMEKVDARSLEGTPGGQAYLLAGAIQEAARLGISGSAEVPNRDGAMTVDERAGTVMVAGVPLSLAEARQALAMIKPGVRNLDRGPGEVELLLVPGYSGLDSKTSEIIDTLISKGFFQGHEQYTEPILRDPFRLLKFNGDLLITAVTPDVTPMEAGKQLNLVKMALEEYLAQLTPSRPLQSRLPVSTLPTRDLAMKSENGKSFSFGNSERQFPVEIVKKVLSGISTFRPEPVARDLPAVGDEKVRRQATTQLLPANFYRYEADGRRSLVDNRIQELLEDLYQEAAGNDRFRYGLEWFFNDRWQVEIRDGVLSVTGGEDVFDTTVLQFFRYFQDWVRKTVRPEVDRLESGERQDAAMTQRTVKVLFADAPAGKDATITAVEKTLATVNAAFPSWDVEIVPLTGVGEKGMEDLKRVIKFEKPAVVLVRSATTFTPELLDLGAANGLKAVVRMGAGYDNINVEYAAEKGISVIRTHGNANSVADLTLYLLASLGQRVGFPTSNVSLATPVAWSTIARTEPAEYLTLTPKSKKWPKGIGPEEQKTVSDEITGRLSAVSNDPVAALAKVLDGKTVGLLGFGPIAQAVAAKLQTIKQETGVNFTVIAATRSFDQKDQERLAEAKRLGVEPVTRAELFKTANIVSLHVPDGVGLGLTQEELSGQNLVAIVNTARGNLVPADLARDFAKNRYLVGDFDLKLDTFNLMKDNPGRVMILPHIGASTQDAGRGIEDNTVAVLPELVARLLGKAPSEDAPVDIVNGVSVPVLTDAAMKSQQVKITVDTKFYQKLPKPFNQVTLWNAVIMELNKKRYQLDRFSSWEIKVDFPSGDSEVIQSTDGEGRAVLMQRTVQLLEKSGKLTFSGILKPVRQPRKPASLDSAMADLVLSTGAKVIPQWAGSVLRGVREDFRFTRTGATELVLNQLQNALPMNAGRWQLLTTRDILIQDLQTYLSHAEKVPAVSVTGLGADQPVRIARQDGQPLGEDVLNAVKSWEAEVRNRIPPTDMAMSDTAMTVETAVREMTKAVGVLAQSYEMELLQNQAENQRRALGGVLIPLTPVVEPIVTFTYKGKNIKMLVTTLTEGKLKTALFAAGVKPDQGLSYVWRGRSFIVSDAAMTGVLSGTRQEVITQIGSWLRDHGWTEVSAEIPTLMSRYNWDKGSTKFLQAPSNKTDILALDLKGGNMATVHGSILDRGPHALDQFSGIYLGRNPAAAGEMWMINQKDGMLVHVGGLDGGKIAFLHGNTSANLPPKEQLVELKVVDAAMADSAINNAFKALSDAVLHNAFPYFKAADLGEARRAILASSRPEVRSLAGEIPEDMVAITAFDAEEFLNKIKGIADTAMTAAAGRSDVLQGIAEGTINQVREGLEKFRLQGRVLVELKSVADGQQETVALADARSAGQEIGLLDENGRVKDQDVAVVVSSAIRYTGRDYDAELVDAAMTAAGNVALRKGGEVPLETARKVYREIVDILQDPSLPRHKALMALAAFLDEHQFTPQDIESYWQREAVLAALETLKGGEIVTSDKQVSSNVAAVIRNTFDFQFPADVFTRDPLKDGAGVDYLSSRLLQDAAMNSPGGIDMNAGNMQMNAQGQKVDVQFDPAMIEQFKRGDFTGLTPVILNITPITNIKPLLGLAPGSLGNESANAAGLESAVRRES